MQLNDELIEYFISQNIFDEDKIDLYFSEDNLDNEYCFSVPLVNSDFTMLASLVPRYNTIYATITDGDCDVISDFMEYLIQLPENVKTTYGDVIEIKSELLQNHGINGVFFSRFRFYELFEKVPDELIFNKVSYYLTAFLFLSKEEVDAFDIGEEYFYSLIEKKILSSSIKLNHEVKNWMKRDTQNKELYYVVVLYFFDCRTVVAKFS